MGWMKRMARHNIDAHRIMPGLYQGSRPQPGDGLYRAGFRSVVFTASEFQPPGDRYVGVEVIRVPLHDDPVDGVAADEWPSVLNAVNLTVRALSNGHRVLVTCWAGINRSGLISALAVSTLTGMSGTEATELVRRHRPGALSNRSFVESLERVQGGRQGSFRAKLVPG